MESQHRTRFNEPLQTKDSTIFHCIEKERERQETGLELIASENTTSRAVLEAQGSILTNKYAEGYPGKRYYGGCEFVDQVEQLAIDRACKLFGSEAANVQPHSGSSANMAVYLALMSPRENHKLMGMNLSEGGHLTHGSPANFSGKFFEVAAYGIDPTTHLLDYDRIRDQVKSERPQVLVAGSSAYPRIIDFERLGQIAKEFEVNYVVDMAHIAGLVATKLHPTPVGHADYVTSTTHKTLRGPRGGIILCSKDRLKKVNSQIFPGIQGGPLMHVIAGKAVALGEALSDEFRVYQEEVIKNAKTLAEELLAEGFHLITGGTDTHLMLLDLTHFQDGDITGKDGEQWLDLAGLTVNKNTVPGEKRSPFVTSGLRVGVPSVTTRGMGSSEMKMIAKWMKRSLATKGDTEALSKIRSEVKELCTSFPLYEN